MNPRSKRIGVVLGVALAIGAAYLARRNSGSRAARQADATEAAPATAPPPDEATRITPATAPAPARARPEPKPTDDEATATARARDLLKTDPDGALARLDAADRAHADGELAEERAALRVDALVSARRIGPARDAAEVYLARYPRGAQAQRIEMLTGVHPRQTESD